MISPVSSALIMVPVADARVKSPVPVLRAKTDAAVVFPTVVVRPAEAAVPILMALSVESVPMDIVPPVKVTPAAVTWLFHAFCVTIYTTVRFPIELMTRHTVEALVLVATHSIQSPAFVEERLPPTPTVVA